MCLKIVVGRCFWEFKMLIGSLVELHAWLHSYLCFSLLEKLFLSNLDTWPICRDLKLFLIAISLAVSTASGSIKKVLGPLIASRQLVDRSSFFLAFVELSLDSSTIASSVDAFFPRHPSRHLFRYLSTPLSIKNYWGSIYSFFAIRFSFLRSLSICLHLFISQTLSPSQLTSSTSILRD